jgi:hypothetical protein
MRIYMSAGGGRWNFLVKGSTYTIQCCRVSMLSRLYSCHKLHYKTKWTSVHLLNISYRFVCLLKFKKLHQLHHNSCWTYVSVRHFIGKTVRDNIHIQWKEGFEVQFDLDYPSFYQQRSMLIKPSGQHCGTASYHLCSWLTGAPMKHNVMCACI